MTKQDNLSKAREISEEFANKDIRPALRIAAEEMAEWKDQQYQPLVNACKDLISTLLTSRTYHLGITVLDTHQEIERKEREGNTALIRSIDREIKYANEIINKLFE